MQQQHFLPLLGNETFNAESHARAILDETRDRLAVGDIGGMNDFVASLNAIRQSCERDDWRRYCEEVVAPHPVRALIHQDPFTGRAFAKPRGYPGDAALLDLIYADRPLVDPISELGARLYRWAIAEPACRSVRARRAILAEIIDRVAGARSAPRVLSVACGHLREAQCSAAVRAGAIAELVALDQDDQSLAVVDREQRSLNVVPVRASIRRLISNGRQFGKFDLVYAAGLYDYLAESTARALTRAMFDLLRPSGTLVVANFAPSLRDIGYMEAIMDWHLLYRDEAGVEGFAGDIAANQIAAKHVFRDAPGSVVYLSLQRT